MAPYRYHKSDLSMNRVNFSEAEAFLAVVDRGGFGAAARELGVTQSTISRRIAALELRIGKRLVERTTRRLALTEAGLAFANDLRDVLARLARCRRPGPVRRGGAGGPAAHHHADGLWPHLRDPAAGGDRQTAPPPSLRTGPVRSLHRHPRGRLRHRHPDRRADTVGAGDAAHRPVSVCMSAPRQTIWPGVRRSASRRISPRMPASCSAPMRRATNGGSNGRAT